MLIVLPFNAAQAESAERLLDWIFALSNKVQSGSCLLLATDDVHPEQQTKVKLTAELAFEFVDLAMVNADTIFMTAVSKVDANYKMPWLYLEPDCVPLKPDWISQLRHFYEGQPKKCAGAWLSDAASGKQYLSRQSVYPPNNFPTDVFAASTKCRLIQYGTYAKREDVREDAVLYCSDKTGELIKSLREEIK